MSKDLTNQLDVLEKPLIFASKNNFKNLSKLKNLEKVIEDITLKLIFQEKDFKLKKELEKIKKGFKNCFWMQILRAFPIHPADW